MTVLDNRVQEYIDKMMAARQQILDTEAAFKVAEAARALAEADRIAAENTRVKNENGRIAAEQTRQQQMVRMQDATTTASTAAARANDAADRAEELYKSELVLDDTLTQIQELYGQMQELKAGIAFTVDGGNPSSADVLVCDGGTPFTTEGIEINCGNP
jgi:hypothetical protein